MGQFHRSFLSGATAGALCLALVGGVTAAAVAEEPEVAPVVAAYSDEAADVLAVLASAGTEDGVVLTDVATAPSQGHGDLALDVSTEVADVTVPVDPEGAVDLTSQSGESLSLWLPHAASAQDAQPIADGIVAYQNDNETLTVPVVKGDGSVQVTTIIESTQSPERFPYEVSLPDGAQAEVVEGGGVQFISSTGEFLGGFTPPWATDAEGASLPTWYEIDGSTVTQVVDHQDSGAAYPVVADPWLGADLFGYTGYNRKGTWGGQVVISAKLSGWGWYWYTTGSGQAILHSAGWSELLKKRPQADDKATLKQQYQCHVVFGYAVWLAGLHWDLEKARVNKSNWLASAASHKCNW
jgi:hypothetical protein